MKTHRRSFPAVIALATVTIWTLSSCSSKSNPMDPGSSGSPPAADAVDISGLAFSPANLTVKAGVKVTWTNKDSATHTVTSDNGAFTSSGSLVTGAIYEFTFPAAGSYPYHSAIHPAMKGIITVTP